MVEELEDKLKRLANEVGIDRALDILCEEMGKTIIERFGITDAKQLLKDAEVPILLSETDRSLAIAYMIKLNRLKIDFELALQNAEKIAEDKIKHKK